MLCKRCMIVMETGTSYEQRKNQNKPSHRRYFECGKCHDRVYTNASNFQEMLLKESNKSRNR